MQAVGKEGHEVLKTGEKHGVVEHTVDEVHREVVAQDDFLEQAVEYPEHGHAELQAAQAVLAVELRDEVAGFYDRSGHQLGEERDVETEIEQVAHRFYQSPVHVGRIADDLERVEGDSHGQDDAVYAEERLAEQPVALGSQQVGHLEGGAAYGIHQVREEVGILEVAQDGQVDGDAQDEESPLLPTRLHAVDELGDKKVAARHEQEQAEKQSARLVVEQNADEKQVSVTKQPFVAEKRENGEDNGKKGPKLELREQQRTVRVEREYTFYIMPQHEQVFFNFHQLVNSRL